MFTEVMAFMSYIATKFQITPNLFQFISSIKSDKVSSPFSNVILGIRMMYYQLTDLCDITFQYISAKYRSGKKTSRPRSVMYSDSLMVSSEGFFNDGLNYKKKGEYLNALTAFQQYRKFHPEDPKVYYEMGYCHFVLENPADALPLIDRALELNYEYGEAFGLKGCILVENKEYQNAMYFLHVGNTLSPRTDFILFALHEAYTAMGMFRSALTCIRQLMEIEPLEIIYHYYHGVVLNCLGLLNSAIESIEKVVEHYPEEKSFFTYLLDLKQLQGEQPKHCYTGMNN